MRIPALCGYFCLWGFVKELNAISGRIAAVADVFDALSMDRIYRPAWPLDEVVQYLIEQKEKQFDPKCVDALLNNFDKVKEVRSWRPSRKRQKR